MPTPPKSPRTCCALAIWREERTRASTHTKQNFNRSGSVQTHPLLCVPIGRLWGSADVPVGAAGSCVPRTWIPLRRKPGVYTKVCNYLACIRHTMASGWRRRKIIKVTIRCVACVMCSSCGSAKDMRFLTRARQKKKMNKRLSLDGDVSYSSGEREAK